MPGAVRVGQSPPRFTFTSLKNNLVPRLGASRPIPDKERFTSGEITAVCGVPFHRVTYFIRTRKIRPVERLGTTRVFCRDDVLRIVAELNAVVPTEGMVPRDDQ